MSLFGKAKVDKVDIKKRFQLIGRVGQGSMSKVWRAEDKMDGRSIAVKVLDKEKTRKFEDRFRGLDKPPEQEIATQLNHPYVVRTVDTGITTEDEVFLVMEFVEGSGLGLLVDLQSDQMKRYRIRYMIQIGEALAYFHQQEWIHRDLCPRNIMVTEKNDIKLIDFGLTVPNTPDFQKPGNRTGTANYLAPELIKRRPTDHRLDIFSYAVTCYEMYTKRHPWDAVLTLDAVMQHINNPPVPLLELAPDVNPRIAEIIMKGLEADRDDRWGTAQEMVDAFREVEPELIRQSKAWFESTGQPVPGSKPKRKAVKTDAKSNPAAPKLNNESQPVASKGKRKIRRMDSDDDIAAALLADDDDLMAFGDDESVAPDPPKTEKSSRPQQSQNRKAAPEPKPPVAQSEIDDDDDILALPED
ncbi:MAG: serine/threonine-protein kinase [Fuerstiella sp.]